MKASSPGHWARNGWGLWDPGPLGVPGGGRSPSLKILMLQLLVIFWGYVNLGVWEGIPGWEHVIGWG